MSYPQTLSCDLLVHVVGGQAPAQPQQKQPQYGAPGSSGNPEGRGQTLYRNGSGEQTARDAGHLLSQMGRGLNPFNWGEMANEVREGYKRGGWGGAFLSGAGVEH